MHFCVVELQIRAILVCFIAVIALMRLYPRMHQHVLLQRSRIREPLATQIALVRPHAVVYPLVVSKLRLVGIRMPAHIANVSTVS